MNPLKHLSFSSLRKELSSVFNALPDGRQSGKVEISVHDALMSGFACMFFQDPSLLQFQKRLEDAEQRSNLQTMFAVNTIPKETQMREIIDGVASEKFGQLFKELYSRLQRGKHLEAYQIFPGKYYFPIDGSQFFSSNDIHCKQCLTKHHSTGSVSYSHQVLQGGIMHPDRPQVIPFMPEQICNEDGGTKQDCEMNAAKRLVAKLRREHPRLNVIIGGDALFSKQPMIEGLLQHRMDYIFSVKASDHQYLFEWIDGFSALHEYQHTDDKGRTHVYEWMNDVPLNGRSDALHVNFFRYQMVGKNKAGEASILFKGSWVTNLQLEKKIIPTITQTARCRWKNENECFNVMKNQGYFMERNYGHGQQHLAFNFYLLTLLAFFFHQIFELTDKVYQDNRKKFSSKMNLWNTLRSYIRIIVFDSWDELSAFALKPTGFRLVPADVKPP